MIDRQITALSLNQSVAEKAGAFLEKLMPDEYANDLLNSGYAAAQLGLLTPTFKPDLHQAIVITDIKSEKCKVMTKPAIQSVRYSPSQ